MCKSLLPLCGQHSSAMEACQMSGTRAWPKLRRARWDGQTSLRDQGEEARRGARPTPAGGGGGGGGGGARPPGGGGRGARGRPGAPPPPPRGRGPAPPPPPPPPPLDP